MMKTCCLWSQMRKGWLQRRLLLQPAELSPYSMTHSSAWTPSRSRLHPCPCLLRARLLRLIILS